MQQDPFSLLGRLLSGQGGQPLQPAAAMRSNMQVMGPAQKLGSQAGGGTVANNGGSIARTPGIAATAATPAKKTNNNKGKSKSKNTTQNSVIQRYPGDRTPLVPGDTPQYPDRQPPGPYDKDDKGGKNGKGGNGGNKDKLSAFEKKMNKIARLGPDAYTPGIRRNLGLNENTIGYGERDPSAFSTDMATKKFMNLFAPSRNPQPAAGTGMLRNLSEEVQPAPTQTGVTWGDAEDPFAPAKQQDPFTF